jgi:serine phosphatase RsbU (regulator of sigma subunit)
MTPPEQFSLWRHLSRTQLVLSVVIGVLALAIAGLVLSVYINIIATNSAFRGSYVLTDLTDIQRAILRLHNANSKGLSTSPIEFELIDLQRALLSSQLRLAEGEAATNVEVAAGLSRIQTMLEEYDAGLAFLRANPTPEQISSSAVELDDLLTDLENFSKSLNNDEERLFFGTISNALRSQRTSQTVLLILSGLLVLFSATLVLSLRRTIKSEFDQAYFRLEAEVAERQQAQEELLKSDAELREVNQHLQALNDHLQQELELARDIQQGLLPPPRPDWNGFEVVCHSSPAYEVGGDFYAYRALDEGRFTLAVGDISGKGLAAALLMATTLAYFDTTLAGASSPGDLLAKLDETLYQHTQTTNQNCALCYVEINGLTLRAANAGGIPPYIRRAKGGVEWLDVKGMPLGLGYGAESGYQPHTATLAPGDLVVMTSDGVVEAHVTTDALFSFERLEQAVAEGPTGSAEAMLEYLQGQVAAFIGPAEPHDDITIVVLQVKG